jgi:hypothetical protein
LGKKMVAQKVASMAGQMVAWLDLTMVDQKVALWGQRMVVPKVVR